ncbi:MAG: hypothetical protein [Olavius algarvensis Delta 4 endosymbiont]|nr:MAG: hypothetical protein [Olavius algarvensis Delta 4 endosymbiont]
MFILYPLHFRHIIGNVTRTALLRDKKSPTRLAVTGRFSTLILTFRIGTKLKNLAKQQVHLNRFSVFII